MSALLFANCNVLTMDRAHPLAAALAVRAGRIVAVGDEREGAAALDGSYERVDCEGGTLLPAFIDAHCHLLSYAASLRSVDCSNAGSIAELQRLIGARASSTPAGQWVRAFGYEETSLAEQRHPDRGDLDIAAPHHPIRLIHASSHASVLNSLGLECAGITTAISEPAGGRIERDLLDGEPSGVLLDMEDWLDCAIPRPSYQDLASSVREASQRMLCWGISCVVDASHTNGRERWDLFERLIVDGAIVQDIIMMEGFDHLGQLPIEAAGGRLRRGAVKIMLHELGDDIWPDEQELARQVAEVNSAGRQVAVHAVGERAVTAAASAIDTALLSRPRTDHRHRIEHCSLLPVDFAQLLAKLAVIVVSQPGLLSRRGERYLQLVPEGQRSRLHPFRTLAESGVAIAAGSDAPVAPPEPLAGVAAAVERRTAAGSAIVPDEAVEPEEALRWWTANAARSTFLESERGSLRPGLRADLVLLDRNPSECAPDELRAIEVRQLWIAGKQTLSR